MGKLKHYHFSKEQDPIDDSIDLDEDYKQYLLKRYISSEEFDLMDNNQLDEIYGDLQNIIRDERVIQESSENKK